MESRKWRLLKKLRSLNNDTVYHACVLYPDKVNCHAQNFRNYVERCLRMRVFDREVDGHPGQHLFQMGIETSKMTILFITKEFLEDGLLMHGAMSAVMKFVTSRGKHRVIPFLLESCKIPLCLRVLHYIPVWKYQHNTDKYSWNKATYQHQLAERIIKAFIGPPPDYKKVKKIGMKQICTRNTKTWKKKVKCISNKILEEEFYKPTLPRSTAEMEKLFSTLGNVIMVCPFGKCRFACRGCFFQKMHAHHETSCSYIPRKCEYCSYKAPRHLLTRHSQMCPYKLEKIKGFSLLHSSVGGSERTYVRRSKELPAKEVVKTQPMTRRQRRRKTNQMRKTNCAKCEDCGKSFSNKECELHRGKCPQRFVPCENFGCKFVGTLSELENHMESCQYRTCSCEHEGCSFQCDNVSEIENHRKCCVYRTVNCCHCGECFQFRKQRDHKCSCKHKISSKIKVLSKFFPGRKKVSENKSSEEKKSLKQQTELVQQTPGKDNSASDTFEGIKNPENEEELSSKIRPSAKKSKSPRGFDQSISTPSNSSYSAQRMPRQASCNATGNSPSLNNVAINRNRFHSLGSSYEEDENNSISKMIEDIHCNVSLRSTCASPFGNH